MNRKYKWKNRYTTQHPTCRRIIDPINYHKFIDISFNISSPAFGSLFPTLIFIRYKFDHISKISRGVVFCLEAIFSLVRAQFWFSTYRWNTITGSSCNRVSLRSVYLLPVRRTHGWFRKTATTVANEMRAQLRRPKGSHGSNAEPIAISPPRRGPRPYDVDDEDDATDGRPKSRSWSVSRNRVRVCALALAWVTHKRQFLTHTDRSDPEKTIQAAKLRRAVTDWTNFTPGRAKICEWKWLTFHIIT